MNETNSIRPLAAKAAQATSPSDGMAPGGVSIVACTSTMQMGPGVVVVQCLLARHCQLARAQKWSH